jgi:hypothetical protein
MSFTVRVAGEEDGPGICRLFSRVFPREMALEEWLWKYPRNPDGWLSVVAEVDGEIAGHYGGWGARALIEGRETPVFSLCDLSTDPATRRIDGPHRMFLAMADTWNGLLRDRGVPFAFGFPGPQAYGAGAARVGYRSHYPVRELRFELQAEEPVPGAAVESVGPAFERLWGAARPLIAKSGFIRDRTRVNWRFPARPDRGYRMLCLEATPGDVLAWAVLSLSQGEALVVDYLARDAGDETFDRLWKALKGEAYRLGARTLVIWEPPGGPWRPHLLDRMRRPGASAFDAGYSLATAVIFDEQCFELFLRSLHFTPSCYDDR